MSIYIYIYMYVYTSVLYYVNYIRTCTWLAEESLLLVVRRAPAARGESKRMPAGVQFGLRRPLPLPKVTSCAHVNFSFARTTGRTTRGRTTAARGAGLTLPLCPAPWMET